MLETFIAYLITFGVCALCVRAEMKEDEKKNNIEESKRKRLKYFLNHCSEARESENRRRL